jgi:uncharacterized membrane protein
LLATVMTVGFVIAMPAAFASGTPHIGGTSAAWLVISGFGNVVGLPLNYSALRIGKVGMVAPVTSTEGAIAAVIAVLAGESLSAGTGATLAVVAAALRSPRTRRRARRIITTCAQRCWPAARRCRSARAFTRRARSGRILASRGQRCRRALSASR